MVYVPEGFSESMIYFANNWHQSDRVLRNMFRVGRRFLRSQLEGADTKFIFKENDREREVILEP